MHRLIQSELIETSQMQSIRIEIYIGAENRTDHFDLLTKRAHRSMQQKLMQNLCGINYIIQKY